MTSQFIRSTDQHDPLGTHEDGQGRHEDGYDPTEEYEKQREGERGQGGRGCVCGGGS